MEGLTLAHLSPLAFMPLYARLKLLEAAPATRDFLAALLQACDPGADVYVPSCVFLAAFMIALHSHSVFRGVDRYTIPLTAAAVRLTGQFNRLLEALVCPGGGVEEVYFMALARGYRETLLEYRRQFAVWKLTDEVYLVKGMEVLNLGPDSVAALRSFSNGGRSQ